MTSENGGTGGPRAVEPNSTELAAALADAADTDGQVPAGVAESLALEHGWGGRLVQVLDIVTADAERMGYLAGGRRPDEVMTWVAMWSDSLLRVEEIRLIIDSGGWDPEPFVALARAGLLAALLRTPDGATRRVRGELAGAWVSDELAMADEAEVVARVEALLRADGDPEPAPGEVPAG